MPALIAGAIAARLGLVRERNAALPWLNARPDEAPLLRSWQRCLDAGISDTDHVEFELVSRAMLADLDDRYGALVRAARPETERLAHAVRGSGCAVVLINSRGVVVDRLCHDAAAPKALQVASRRGVNLDERCIGTSAPSIVLAEGQPALVGRDAHFCANVRPFFCVAAPIDAPDGTRLGALDLTAYDSVPGFDVLSLVVDAAAAIENQLFASADDQLVLAMHPRASLVGTPLQALLAVDADGRIAGANRAALRLLCATRDELLGLTPRELLQVDTDQLMRNNPRPHDDLFELTTRSGLRLCAQLRPGAAVPADVFDAVAPVRASRSLREVQVRTIEAALEQRNGNVSAAARELGISRNTIYRRLQDKAK